MVAVLVVALASPATRAAEPNWSESLTIVTASPGGTYYAYGEGLAKILIRVLNMSVSMRPTQGPSENIRLIEAGEAQLGFVTMGIALQAWNGTGEWTGGKQYRSIRALFPMYDTPFHFVVLKDSPIRSLADVAGKRVGIGPQGGTGGAYVPRILAALKIQASPAVGSWADLAAELQAQTVDVLGAAVGAPFPAVAELDAKKAVRFVPLSQNEVFSLRLAIPELTPSLIPAGTYPSLMRNYETVGLYNFAVAHQDLPPDLAYRIVDAVFSHHQEMIEVHPAAAATVPENFVYNTFLPYHPGAARYYGNLVQSDAARGD
jgi:uncharacterized protein